MTREAQAQEPSNRRAWTITFVIGALLAIVGAVVFSVTYTTRSVAQDAADLQNLGEVYQQATVARADAAFVIHLRELDRRLDIIDVSSNLETSIDGARGAVDGIEASVQQLQAYDLPATGQFLQIVREVLVEPVAGGTAREDLDDDLVSTFDATRAEIAALRAPIVERVHAKDSSAAFWGDLARFAVALIVPMGLVLIFRELVMRQYRQRELEMNLEAEQQLAKARDELVANTSHELRTPLTAISGLGQLLEEDPRLPDDVREMLRMMNSESADLARMVEDLLTTARLASGQLRYEPGSVESAEEASTVVRPFAQNGHDIIVDVEPAELWVDRLRLRQVLRNLLSNAVKYGGDRIELRGWAGPSHYEWMVVDNGPGVPEELRERLFQRYVHSLTFQQAVAGGVGLGLSIVKSLAEGMGGNVEYRRVLGESIFSVRVPIRTGQVEAVEPREELAAVET